jgi:hypothetical protein
MSLGGLIAQNTVGNLREVLRTERFTRFTVADLFYKIALESVLISSQLTIRVLPVMSCGVRANSDGPRRMVLISVPLIIFLLVMIGASFTVPQPP